MIWRLSVTNSRKGRGYYDITNSLRSLAICLAMLCSSVGSTGFASVYYVDNIIGDDTDYDGLSATVSGKVGPFQTIQHAVDVAIAGYSGVADTIWVKKTSAS